MPRRANDENDSKPKQQRNKNYCFTLNNYTEDNVRGLIEDYNNGKYRFLCFGFETAPTTGTPHLQGYVELKNGRGMDSLNKDKGFANKANLQIRNGTKIQAITYCAKVYGALLMGYINHLAIQEGKTEDTRIRPTDFTDNEVITWLRENFDRWTNSLFDKELIDPTDYSENNNIFIMLGDLEAGMKQGTRSDIAKIRDNIIATGKMPTQENLPLNLNLIRYAEKLIQYTPLSPFPFFKNNTWIWGDSGTHKTREAMEAIQALMEKDKFLTFFKSLRNGAWQDGYWGQELVIFDDIRPDTWPFGILLALTDIWDLRVEVKGGTAIWRPNKIWVTAPSSPIEMYKYCDEEIYQLVRRFDAFIEKRRKPDDTIEIINHSREDMLKKAEEHDKSRKNRSKKSYRVDVSTFNGISSTGAIKRIETPITINVNKPPIQTINVATQPPPVIKQETKAPSYMKNVMAAVKKIKLDPAYNDEIIA